MTQTNHYSETWFTTFLSTIPPERTASEVNFLRHHLPNPPYNAILDVCCGQGRHAHALAQHGYHITGIDTNERAIQIAQQNSTDNETYIVHDMRRIQNLEQRFDAVLCLWQSFGYFDEATNTDILRQIHSTLNPNGRFILDIYNPAFFIKYQGKREFTHNTCNITETKTIANNRLTVELDYDGDTQDIFEWQLYTPDDIKTLADAIGFDCLHIHTRYTTDADVNENAIRLQYVLQKR